MSLRVLCCKRRFDRMSNSANERIMGASDSGAEIAAAFRRGTGDFGSSPLDHAARPQPAELRARSLLVSLSSGGLNVETDPYNTCKGIDRCRETS
jgi:hypothetical protein